MIPPPITLPDNNDDENNDNHSEYTPDVVETTPQLTNATTQVASSHRRRGRLKESKNKPKTASITVNVTNVVNDSYLNDQTTHTIDETRSTRIDETFLTAKEKYDYQLSLTLRSEGKITTPDKPFEASD